MKNKALWIALGSVGLVVVLTIVAFATGGMFGNYDVGEEYDGRKNDYYATSGEYGASAQRPAEPQGVMLDASDATKAMTAKDEGRGRGDMEMITTPGGSYPASTLPLFGQMMKKDGSISIEAEKPKEAFQNAIKIAKKYGGDILDSQSSGSSYGQYFEMTIRVPVGKFEEAKSDLMNLGEVLNDSSTSEDVSNQYVDLKARLSSRENLKTRLTTLLNRADKIGDMLSIQDRITNVEQEIESLKGQMQYLEGMTSFSRIHVTITGPGSEPIDNGEDTMFVKGLKKIWEAFQQAILWIIMFLAVAAPFGLIVWLVVWLIIKYMKKNKAA